MTQCRAVAFYNEDLEEIDPLFTVYSLEVPVFNEAMAITIMAGDQVIGSAGVTKVYKGVGHCWCFVDKNATDLQGARMLVLMKGHLLNGMEKHKLHRVQADVMAGFEKGARLVEFCGFKFEGRMTAYGPNREDFDRYALVR